MSTPADGTARASQPGSVPSVQETSYLSRPEGRIGYDVAGDGSLVVLVPGARTVRCLAPRTGAGTPPCTASNSPKNLTSTRPPYDRRPGQYLSSLRPR